jgi:drug/metabolite transporter (DMT)-like permease
LWAAFPIVSIATYQFLNPIATLAWSTFFAAIFFGILFLIKKGWCEIKSWSVFRPIIAATFLIGILFYFLFFIGMRFTTASNAALVGSMELWFSFIFFGLVLRKEKYSWTALLGASLMFIGILFVIFPGRFEFNQGDILILFAAMIPPLGNHFQQIARQKVSATTLLFFRSLLATPFLFLISHFFESGKSINFESALPFLLLNGFLLFGFSKILWVEGIHRISVAKAAAINSFLPAFTLFYAFVFLDQLPTTFQLLGLPFLIFGAILITRNNFLREPLLD